MKKVLTVIGIIILGLVAVSLIYLNINQYSASAESEELFNTNAVEVNDYYEIDHDSNVGLIFYPGAKVDSQAYAYLSEVEEANIYIADFPFNFAFFNPNIAQVIIEDNNDVDEWYVAGHSLGGVFAYNFAQNNLDEISGVVFLASYPAEKIPEESPLKVLSLYGGNDGVVGSYDEKLELFNDNSTLYEIEGANHSQFGDYGLQKGDNEAEISKEEQHQVIVEQIAEFI